MEVALGKTVFHSLKVLLVVMTGRSGEVIVRGQLQQTGMKAHLIFVAGQNHTAHVVVEDDAGTTLKLGKGLNVSMQQAFQSLIKEEVQGQGARVGKRDDKAGKPAAGLPDAHWAEVRPIGLCLLTGKGSQLPERLLHHGTETGHQTAQLRGSACIAAGADHLEDAGGTQARIPSQGLANEIDIGISLAAGAILFGAIETICFQGRTHGITMQVQLCGDGSDLPVFGKKQKADFCYQLGIDHGSPAGAEDLDELPPASANDAKEAIKPLLPATGV